MNMCNILMLWKSIKVFQEKAEFFAAGSYDVISFYYVFTAKCIGFVAKNCDYERKCRRLIPFLFRYKIYWILIVSTSILRKVC
jgi:hypothetical protein